MPESHLQLIGASAALREVLAEAELAAETSAKVLITGESGVGKEILAKLIHRRSPRRNAPLVTINCAGLPDSLLESELFGHVRGSFTGAFRDRQGLFERAHGGTVFMDEVGEMSLRMQTLLLRFLETGEVQRVGSDSPHARFDVRLIAATNRDLLARIASKEFREDLYYRLNVIHLKLPPLRERRVDIPPLVSHFLAHFADEHRAPVLEIAPDALAALVNHDWPGNVRELRNVIERMVVRVRTGILTVADIPEEVCARRGGASLPSTEGSDALADSLLSRMGRGETFWAVVYAQYMGRNLRRDDVRAVVGRGLERTQGSYKLLTNLFNIRPEHYKRFLNFLRKHDCHVPYHRFRVIEGGADSYTPARDDSAARQRTANG